MAKTYMKWRWWTIALRGLAAVVLGIVSLFAPQLAFLSLVFVFGVYAIVDGVLSLSIGTTRARANRGLIIARGLVSLAAGAIAIVWPGMTSLALILVIAAWAVMSGILEIAAAIRMREVIRHEWLLGIEGVLSVGFGVVLFIAPLTGVIVIGLWLGAFALILGGMMIGTAFRVRSFVREHPDVAVAAA
jgi:uncharacterized membrane protein HdeD (DUF308 family)